MPDALEGVEEAVGPARRHTAALLSTYAPEQQALLFDYFARATPAFRAATEEIRANTAPRRGKSRTGANGPVGPDTPTGSQDPA
ncbi:hypothetical protein [Streptomyces sp. G-G2]|uniref:hypothetical protein n=1 Tax=Streptomyces sp. G-G2 TaxID=3046201 RepID=UPI0024B8DBD4|nr:hypothetical protein [Streptomyces sp. G-G2]